MVLKKWRFKFGIVNLKKWRYQIGMGIVVYNEWQKERLPLGPSSAVDAADLNRRLCRRHTPRVKASARSSFSSSAQFTSLGCGDKDFFFTASRGKGKSSAEPDRSKNKFRDLATPTLLHFGNAQASLALHSTSAAPIMGEVRYNSLMKTIPQEAEELFVATERNAKLRYEGYKKLSEM